MDALYILICPPHRDFAEQPKDISKAVLANCPHCDDLMWFSEKNRELFEYALGTRKDYYLGCYRCFTSWALNNKEKVLRTVPVQI